MERKFHRLFYKPPCLPKAIVKTHLHKKIESLIKWIKTDKTDFLVILTILFAKNPNH